MSKFYASEVKKFRAQAAVESPEKFAKDNGEGCAELVLVKRGKEEGLKGEALVDYVYEGLGGRIMSEAPEKVADEPKAPRKARKPKDPDDEDS